MLLDKQNSIVLTLNQTAFTYITLNVNQKKKIYFKELITAPNNYIFSIFLLNVD